MPSDLVYGGSGVEVLFPNEVMNNHFSEPEWNAQNSVRRQPKLPLCF